MDSIIMNGLQITLTVSGSVLIAVLAATAYFKRKLRHADAELRVLWDRWWHSRGDEELQSVQDEDD